MVAVDLPTRSNLDPGRSSLKRKTESRVHVKEREAFLQSNFGRNLRQIRLLARCDSASSTMIWPRRQSLLDQSATSCLKDDPAGTVFAASVPGITSQAFSISAVVRLDNHRRTPAQSLADERGDMAKSIRSQSSRPGECSEAKVVDCVMWNSDG